MRKKLFQPKLSLFSVPFLSFGKIQCALFNLSYEFLIHLFITIFILYYLFLDLNFVLRPLSSQIFSHI